QLVGAGLPGERLGEEVEIALADGLRRVGQPEAKRQRAVDLEESALFVLEEDAVGKGVEQHQHPLPLQGERRLLAWRQLTRCPAVDAVQWSRLGDPVGSWEWDLAANFARRPGFARRWWAGRRAGQRPLDVPEPGEEHPGFVQKLLAVVGIHGSLSRPT